MTQTTFPVSRRRHDARGQYPKLPLKGASTGSSGSKLVKMPHCWKSHVASHILKVVAVIHAVVVSIVVTVLISYRTAHISQKFLPICIWLLATRAGFSTRLLGLTSHE